jgi:hypothetical protein
LENGLEAFDCLARERRRAEELDERGRATTERMEERFALCKRLEAGTMTLLEVAARFRILDSYLERRDFEALGLWTGGSEGERFCLRVIDYVTVIYPDYDGPNPALPALRARLRAELRNYLNQYGTILLPEIGPM